MNPGLANSQDRNKELIKEQPSVEVEAILVTLVRKVELVAGVKDVTGGVCAPQRTKIERTAMARRLEQVG